MSDVKWVQVKCLLWDGGGGGQGILRYLKISINHQTQCQIMSHSLNYHCNDACRVLYCRPASYQWSASTSRRLFISILFPIRSLKGPIWDKNNQLLCQIMSAVVASSFPPDLSLSSCLHVALSSRPSRCLLGFVAPAAPTVFLSPLIYIPSWWMGPAETRGETLDTQCAAASRLYMCRVKQDHTSSYRFLLSHPWWDHHTNEKLSLFHCHQLFFSWHTGCFSKK